jgi:hypothetical protein
MFVIRYIVVVLCFGFVGWFYFDERCNGRDVFLCRRSSRKHSAHVSLVGNSRTGSSSR